MSELKLGSNDPSEFEMVFNRLKNAIDNYNELKDCLHIVKRTLVSEPAPPAVEDKLPPEDGIVSRFLILAIRVEDINTETKRIFERLKRIVG